MTTSSPSTSAPSAGVLGLGIIGSRVARRLISAGYSPSLWNRTARDFEGLPATLAHPAAVAAQADVLQIFVFDDAALRQTIEALLPALTPEHILLNHSTVSPETVRQLAKEVAESGAVLLDAPFTGSRDAAAQGKITYYVSGCPNALERTRPVLAASATSIVPLGDIGQASAIKIATNIIAAAATVSLAEAMNLLRAQGIDPQVLATALESNAARSGVTDLKMPCMLDQDFAPRFSARNLRKDLELACDLADEGQASLTHAMARLFTKACQDGLGDEDFSAVVKVTNS